MTVEELINELTKLNPKTVVYVRGTDGWSYKLDTVFDGDAYIELEA